MAGKKQAKRNVARLNAMHGAIADMLAEEGLTCDGSPMQESGRRHQGLTGDPEEGRALVEALLMQGDSLDAKRATMQQAIRTALRAKLRDPMAPPDSCGPWVYVRDFFDAAVVFSVEDDYDKLYQVAYAADWSTDPPTISLGDPVEVEVAYVPKASSATEAADAPIEVGFVPLVEAAAIAKDGTVKLKLIDPGWGSSGYYPPAVLKRDGPKVFTEGTKMYLDHPTPSEEAERPERSLQDLAAVLTTNATWQDAGPAGPGLYAEAKVYDQHRQLLADVAPDIGVSIRAMGRGAIGAAEGRKGFVIQELANAKSVDFVTDPGRGGRILALAESKRASNPGPAAGTPGKQPADDRRGNMPTIEELQGQVSALQESNKTLTDSNKALTESVNKLEGTVENLQARQTEAVILGESRKIVDKVLGGFTNMPAITRDRLAPQLAGNPVLKDGAIDEVAFTEAITNAAKAEMEYLNVVNGGGGVRGMGPSLLTEGAGDAPKPEDVEKQLTESFQAMGLSESAAKLAAQGRG